MYKNGGNGFTLFDRVVLYLSIECILKKKEARKTAKNMAMVDSRRISESKKEMVRN